MFDGDNNPPSSLSMDSRVIVSERTDTTMRKFASVPASASMAAPLTSSSSSSDHVMILRSASKQIDSNAAAVYAYACACAYDSDSESEFESSCSMLESINHIPSDTSLINTNRDTDTERIITPPSLARLPIFPLYDDILRVLIHYFLLHELSILAHVSHQWNRVIRSTKPIGYIILDSKKFIEIPLNSSVAIHVNRVIPHRQLPTQLIMQLPQYLPNLTELTCDLNQAKLQLQDAAMISFPRSLQSLVISAESHVLDSMGGSFLSCTELRMLTLNICCDREVTMLDIHFPSLLPCPFPTLEALRMAFCIPTTPHAIDSVDCMCRFSPSVLQFIRQRSNLKALSFRLPQQECLHSVYTDLMKDGLSYPLFESGTLQSIQCCDSHFPLSRMLQTALRIPSLTSLGFIEFDPRMQYPLHLLSQFPALAELHFLAYSGRYDPNKTIETCKFAPQVRNLVISGFLIDLPFLPQCLRHLPTLTELEITISRVLIDLSPLIEFGLPKRLIKLSIDGRIKLSDFDYILSLETLESLQLQLACLEGTSEQRLKTQLAALPNLKKCSMSMTCPTDPRVSIPGSEECTVFQTIEFRL